MLEHHADVLAHLVEVDLLVGQVELVDDDLAAGDVLQLVQAAQERRLAGARRPDDADHFTLADGGVDAVEHLQVAERLLQAFDADLDGAFGFGGRGLGDELAHLLILFSRRSESLVSAMMTMK